MTTKMSAAHEITYSILVYLAAADGDGSGSASGDGGLNFGTNKKLDEKRTGHHWSGVQIRNQTGLCEVFSKSIIMTKM